VGKLRKMNGKSRRYVRSLLEVVKTYEEISLDSAAALGEGRGIDDSSGGAGGGVSGFGSKASIGRRHDQGNSNASRTMSILEELEESLHL
jgi:hypothetical protein